MVNDCNDYSMIQDLMNRYQQLTIDFMDDDDSNGLTAISGWRFHYAFMDESTTGLQTYVDATNQAAYVLIFSSAVKIDPVALTHFLLL